MSYKVTVVPSTGNNPATAKIEDAQILDLFTTALSTDSALTGSLGLVQKVGLFVGGMSVQNKRKLGSFNPL